MPLLAQDPMLPRRHRVTRAWREMEDVASVELAPLDGGPSPFLPGQFNMLYAFGIGEVPISISGDPARPERLVHTTRSVGAVSAALTALDRGDVVGVRGPFGSAWPVEGERGRHLVLVGGGIGLAPLRPAVREALGARGEYEGVSIVYGARSPEALLYADELRIWRSRPDVQLEVTVDHAAHGWSGRVGVVTTPLEDVLAGLDAARVSAFVCGPEVMMRFAFRTLAAAGVPAERVWISMERNMKCAVGFCGHCQLGPEFVCRDGPVFRYDRVARILGVQEV